MDDKKQNTELIIESCLKAVATQIPIVSAAASFYSDWRNQIEYKNIYNLIEEHAKLLQEIKDSLDNNYLQSEDYAYTLHKTILKAKNEIRENKRKLFAEFLTRSCVLKNSGNTDKMIFLEIIDKIELEHVTLLRYLYGKKDSIKDGWTIDMFMARETKLSEERLRFMIQYFISIGLVMHFYNFEIKDDGNLWSETRYFVSDLGVDLLEYFKK